MELRVQYAPVVNPHFVIPTDSSPDLRLFLGPLTLICLIAHR